MVFDKNILRVPGRLVAALAFTLPFAVYGQKVLVHDDFQQNAAGAPLVQSVTTDGIWYWHMEEGHGTPTIGEHNDNRFAYYWNEEGSQSVYRMTLRNLSTSNFLTFEEGKPLEFEFDYLYFTAWEDNQWFSVDYLLADRYTNMGAGGTTDPVGYRLSLKVASNTRLEYRIMHKAQGTWNPVPGSEGAYETTGLLHPDSGVPGNPVNVRLRAFGSHHQLWLDGEQVLDLQIDAHPQNAEFNGPSFLQFWNNTGRVRGFDNLTVRQLPLPPVEIVPGELYWTNVSAVRASEFDGSNPRTAGVETNRAIGVALDAANSRLYWTEDAGGKIVSAGLDGTEPKEIVTLEFVGTTLESGQMLALDEARGRLYWAEWRRGLFTSDLDGNDVQQLTDIANYGAVSGSATVTVDSTTGDVYWGLATTGEIFRVSSDGSSVEPVATLGSNTYGTAVDGVQNRLYYTKFSEGTLNFYDLSAGTTTTLLSGLGQPLGVALNEAGDRIYWVERTGGLVRTASLSDGTIGAPETLVEGENSPFGIAVLKQSDSVSFNSWIASFGIPESLQGADSDPDGDGLANLLEYAIGSNPAAADSATEGPVQSRETIDEVECLTLTVSKNPAAIGVNLVFETSTDLATWTAAGDEIAVVSETANEIKVALPLSGETDGRRFLRLRVSQE